MNIFNANREDKGDIIKNELIQFCKRSGTICATVSSNFDPEGDTSVKFGNINHITTLDRALESIGENAKLPIELYGADGKQASPLLKRSIVSRSSLHNQPD